MLRGMHLDDRRAEQIRGTGLKRILLCAALLAAQSPDAHSADYAVARWTGFDTINARSIAVGDVNWDRLDDLVVFSDGSDAEIDELRIYLQQPDGTLKETTDDLWSMTFSPSVIMVDIDNNSEKEIIVGSPTGFERIYYTNGMFYSRHVAAASGCANVAAADLDSDRYADIVCQSISSGATVFRNDQRGEFPTTASVSTARVPDATIALGDLTGDSKPDLLLSAPGMSGFAVHPHDGAGGFGAAVSYPRPSAAGIGASAIGDLDHDGRPDALVAPTGFSPAALWIYSRGVDGRLAASRRGATGRLPGALLVNDLNRDGRDDIVVGSGSGLGIGYHLQGGTGYLAFGGAAIFAGDSSGLAAGDLDDDGCTDVVYTTTTGGVAIAHGKNCIRARARGDFDGDGKADLLWHNDASGANVTWKAADSTNAQNLTSVTDLAWRIVGTGDFDGDGKADLLWRKDTTGAGVIWYSGNSSTAKNLTQVTNLAWRIVGIGDFDGDRFDDILWRNTSDGRNTVWRSGNSSTQLAVAAVTDQNGQVAGVGDFDGDGKDDILWRNPATWANVVWRSGNSKTVLAVASNSDSGARVWIGDYNGDRRADLLWAYSNGEFRIWLKPDASEGQQNEQMSSDWKIAATGDYDGNGTSDLLWRNMRTGENVIWRSAASRVARKITAVTNFNWTVQQ